jgi:putative spermidine/putrescine transport system permease protein
MMLHSREFALAAPALVFVLICVIAPLFLTVPISLDAPNWSLRNYSHLIEQSTYAVVMVTTFRLALVTAILSLVLGYPFGYLLGTTRGVWSRLGMAIVVYSLWVSLLVRTLAWILLLQRNGIARDLVLRVGFRDGPELLHTLTGAVVAMTHILLPFQVLPVYVATRNLDRTLVDAARSLGAGTFATWLFIELPLTARAAGIGAAFVFLSAFGFYITPALIGGPRETTLAMLIDELINRLLAWGPGFALSNVMVLATIAVQLLLLSLMWRRKSDA